MLKTFPILQTLVGIIFTLGIRRLDRVPSRTATTNLPEHPHGNPLDKRYLAGDS